MKIKEVVPSNPLKAQADQLTKSATEMKQQAQRLNATQKVNKARESLTKAVQQQSKVNQPKPLPLK